VDAPDPLRAVELRADDDVRDGDGRDENVVAGDPARGRGG